MKKIIIFLMFVSMNLSAQEEPTITPVTAINTDMDEYAPIIINTFDIQDGSRKPSLLIFSRSDIGSKDGITELRSISVNADLKSYVNDPKDYYIIDGFFERSNKTILKDHACLSTNHISGLVVRHKGEMEAQGVELKNNRIKLNSNFALSEQISKDFDGSFYSHFSYKEDIFVFMTSDIVTCNGQVSKGGYDIWYYIYNRHDQKWHGPMNMTWINTKDDEIAPVIDINGSHLFFSSNSFKYEPYKDSTGFDIYYVILPGMKHFFSNIEEFCRDGFRRVKPRLIEELLNDATKTTLKKFKINTKYDEMFFYRVDEKQAFFCTDQYDSAGHNLEIAHITPVPPYLPPGEIGVKAIDCNTNEPMSDLEIFLKRKENGQFRMAHKGYTDQYGTIFFHDLLPGDYRVTANSMGENYVSELEIFEDRDLNSNKNNFFKIEVGECSGDTMRLVINFDQDRATIRPDGVRLLMDSIPKLKKILRNQRSAKCIVEGHTSKEASRAHNCDLSLRRANAVMDWIIEKLGNDYNRRFKVVRYGECSPFLIEKGYTGSELNRRRRLNRRVEVVIFSGGNNTRSDNESNCYECNESGG